MTIRILQSMVSGICLILGLRTRMEHLYVNVASRTPIYGAALTSPPPHPMVEGLGFKV